ncbi:MAG: T9SS type A sorting domain-containing protein, partial [Bacteroidia bacterium]|nr:T9SS type A sorting domain-containing protein [Bacteroidia bacterium]
YGANTGSIQFFVSDDEGLTWTPAWSAFGQQQVSSSESWRLASVSLLGFANSTVLLGWSGITGAGFASDMALDAIRVFDNNAPDAGILSIDSLASKCSFTNSEQIHVQIRNFSGVPISNIPLSYRINNGIPVNETYNDTIAPGTTVNYVFTTTADLSTVGNYNIKAYSGLITDADRANDTSIVSVANLPNVSSFPYFTSWENGSDGWTSEGANDSWERGIPANNIISSASHGSIAWVTDLNGDYQDNEISYLTSPCFDLTNVGADPSVRFAHIFDLENNFDRSWFQYSFDGGNSWTTLGSNGSGINWYNAAGSNNYWTGVSNGWRIAEHILTGSAGQSDVRLRFVLTSDFTATREGIGIDAFELIPAIENDGSVELLKEYSIIPHKQAAIMNRFKVRNNGVFTMHNVAVAFNVKNNIGTIVLTDTLRVDSLQAAQSINLSSTLPFIASNFSSHRISAVLSSDIDEYSGNDSIINEVVQVSKSEYARDDGNLNFGTLGIGASVNDGGQLGQYFEIIEEDWISTIKFHLLFPPRGDTIHANLYSCFPNGSPDSLIASTVDYIITPDDEVNGVLLELPLKDGLVILSPGKYFLSIIEPGVNITLTISNNIYTPGVAYATWATNPFGAGVWTEIEMFGWENAFYIRGLLSDCGVRPFIVDSIIVHESSAGASDGSIDLQITGGFPPYTFLWTNGSTTEDLNNLTSGLYCVTILDSIGCGVDRCYTIDVNVGLDEIDPGANVSVYPNPANNHIRINFDGPMPLSSDIKVYDQIGSLVLEKELFANERSIDIGMLSQGNYIIRIQTSTYSIVRKFQILR